MTDLNGVTDLNEPLSPHCYVCGSESCIEGRFLTMLCPSNVPCPVCKAPSKNRCINQQTATEVEEFHPQRADALKLDLQKRNKRNYD